MFNSKIETITPAKALKYLEKNINNRRKKPVQIKKYAEAMARGEWILTGEAIKFDVDGNLLDGQNRLFACVMANKSFITVVQRGLKREVFFALDTGIKRTGADSLTVEGFKNTTILAAALRIIADYKKDPQLKMTTQWTNKELLDLLENEEGIEESVSYIARFQHINNTSRGAFAAMHHLFALRDSEKADEFFEKLYHGEELKRGNPILLLRNRFMNMKMESTRNRKDQIEMLVKAWNMFRNGNNATHIKVVGNIPEIK